METLNSCGKEVFQVSDVDRLKRFLSLGSENGTYYINTKDLTEQNVSCIDRLLASDILRDKVLEIINDYAVNNKCKKQDPLVYTLARCCVHNINDPNMLDFRKRAYDMVKLVCTIPTTLFLFIDFCKKTCKKLYNSSGWNNLHKNTLTEWYITKSPTTLVYQATKYKERHKYSHRDVLRLAHITPSTKDLQIIFKYLVKGYEDIARDYAHEHGIEVLEFIRDFERMKGPIDDDAIVELIHKWKFAREHIPNDRFNKTIWEALVDHMPNIGLLRNLNKLSMYGVLDNLCNVAKVNTKIKNIRNLHPMHLLIALKMYASGAGHKGNKTWEPNQDVVDTMDYKFYDLFSDCRSSNKRICIAMDVSGSMHCSSVMGTECMNAAEVSCALAMVMKASNPNSEIMGFSSGFVPLRISPLKRLDDNMSVIRNLPFSSTDISLPFTWAQQNNKPFDAFVVLTDNETNVNRIRPSDALKQYRTHMNIPDCKLVVVAMSANGFSVADPNDKYMLDIAGFDGSVPDLINEFIEGEL